VRLDIFRETGHRTLRQAGVHHPLALITIFRSPDPGTTATELAGAHNGYMRGWRRLVDHIV